MNGSLVRSQVSRVCAEVLDAAEEWQRAMREEGWRPAVPWVAVVLPCRPSSLVPAITPRFEADDPGSKSEPDD